MPVIPPQPALPPEDFYSETELAYIEEQALIFPTNQDSNWGLRRRIFAEQAQLIADDIDTLWRNRFPTTALEHLDLWEKQLGLPINPPNTDQERRAAISARVTKGPFTRAKVRSIVEKYIGAVFGEPLSLVGGIPLTGSGSSMPSVAAEDPTDFYNITEFIELFRYRIGLSTEITVDMAGLSRELDRLTPAGIEWVVASDFIKKLGATSSFVGAMAKAPLEDIPSKTFVGRSPAVGGHAHEIVIGSFDADFDQWTVTDPDLNASITPSIDTGIMQVGAGSLKMVQTDANKTEYALREFPVSPGQVWQVKAWLNCTVFTAGAFQDRAVQLAVKPNFSNQSASALTAVTAGWVEHTRQLTIPSGENTLIVRLHPPQGTIYYDDVRLRRLS